MAARKDAPTAKSHSKHRAVVRARTAAAEVRILPRPLTNLYNTMRNYIPKPQGIFYDPKRQRAMEHKGAGTRIYWSPQMISELRRWYPTKLNAEVAELLGLSVRTIIRKARELGLVKDPEWLAAIWDERRYWASVARKAKGYPGCFKPGNMIGAEYRFKPKTTKL